MKIRKISLTLKHSAQLSTRRGDRWVGMELSAEAELSDRDRLPTAAAKLAEQLSAELNRLWRERVRNGENSAPATLPISNAPAPVQAPPITAETHGPNGTDPEASGQPVAGAEKEE
jgi:hypothetical protein